MPTDLSTAQVFPYFAEIALANSNAHKIIISEKSKSITIGSEAKKVYVARNGATDGAAMPANKVWVTAGNLIQFEWQLGTGKTEEIYISTDAPPANVIVIME